MDGLNLINLPLDYNFTITEDSHECPQLITDLLAKIDTAISRIENISDPSDDEVCEVISVNQDDEGKLITFDDEEEQSPGGEIFLEDINKNPSGFLESYTNDAPEHELPVVKPKKLQSKHSHKCKHYSHHDNITTEAESSSHRRHRSKKRSEEEETVSLSEYDDYKRSQSQTERDRYRHKSKNRKHRHRHVEPSSSHFNNQDYEYRSQDETVAKVRAVPRRLVSYEDSVESIVSVEEIPVSNSRTKINNKLIDKTETQDYGTGPEMFYCPACQLVLNSQLTWESHIQGKKHAKALNAQAVHEIAKSSIAQSIHPLSKDGPRFAGPPMGRKRILVADISKIQSTVNEHKEHPMPGLDHILEIRVERETNFYCNLCDAPCTPSSIMPHLIGFKHQLNCLRVLNSQHYENMKDRPKKSIERKVIKELFSYQRHYGKGIIKVYRDVLELDMKTNTHLLLEGGEFNSRRYGSSHSMSDEGLPSTSRGYASNDDYLDTSKGDLRCRACDSHMNNISMWEAHVRGRRHLKNTKKVPGESVSKGKVFKAPPNAHCFLKDQLRSEAQGEIIVGLNYIRETQGPNGEFYNCFVCGSCCTNIDIIDHLLSVKHRIKYLAKMHADGHRNAIETISQMDLSDIYFRENLVVEECLRMEQKYGSGSVEVCITKN